MRDEPIQFKKVKTHKDLLVWQRSFELVKDLYQITAHFPQSEIYGLTSQIRRAAVSIPANIAEGCGRFSSDEYARFISIAHGSSAELDTLLLLAGELGYMDKQKIDELIQENDEISRMMNSLRRKIKES